MSCETAASEQLHRVGHHLCIEATHLLEVLVVLELREQSEQHMQRLSEGAVVVHGDVEEGTHDAVMVGEGSSWGRVWAC